MARTALTVYTATPSAKLDDPAGDAVNPGAGNGHYVPASVPANEAFLRLDLTGANKDVTIVAGDNPPAIAQGLGDLTENVIASTHGWFGPLDSSRFAQSDGTVHVDIETGASGTITLFHIPRTV